MEWPVGLALKLPYLNKLTDSFTFHLWKCPPKIAGATILPIYIQAFPRRLHRPSLTTISVIQARHNTSENKTDFRQLFHENHSFFKL